MAYKEYFVKVSWQDPAQPLRRIHDNSVMELDLTKDSFEIVKEAERFQMGRYSGAEDFTIDFMIPTGRED